jgi:CheY-like chemotaxis protein
VRPQASAERGCVLVVDDEPMMVRAIQRLLEGDYEVVATTDPIDAVAQLRQGRRFDAILCDLMMPTLSGMEVYDAIRKIEPDQARRMVFMTGGAFTSAVLAFLESVENARIEKPLERAALRDLLRAQVQSGRFRI